MKKVLFTVMIIMFTTSVTSYAQLFKDRNPETESKEITKVPIDNSGGGIFKNDRPGGRPESGEGIGQLPIKDDISVWIVCCSVLVVVKIFKRKGTNERQ